MFKCFQNQDVNIYKEEKTKLFKWIYLFNLFMPILLTLCMLGNSTCFLLSTVFFFKIYIFEKFF